MIRSGLFGRMNCLVLIMVDVIVSQYPCLFLFLIFFFIFFRQHLEADEVGIEDIFDVHLTSSFSSATLIDIQPYRPSTDPLLFTYPELLSIITTSTTSTDPDRPRLPILRVVDSAAHPQASRATPAYGTNMMPVEMVEMSQGRTVEGFREVWEESVRRGMTE